MNAEQKVLDYYKLWANKGVNPLNGMKVVQEGKTLESFGVVLHHAELGFHFRHSPSHYSYSNEH